jgi:uncharacterized BrkB/YihY/UPF0761 family membrane protein
VAELVKATDRWRSNLLALNGSVLAMVITLAAITASLALLIFGMIGAMKLGSAFASFEPVDSIYFEIAPLPPSP